MISGAFQPGPNSDGSKPGNVVAEYKESFMATPGDPGLRDVATLTRAVEKVFRKLIRMLIGKMSLKKLQEMIQIIFVEETEAKLKREAPGKNWTPERSKRSEPTLPLVTRFTRMTLSWTDLCHCSRSLISG
jgi:hypothetical protein